MSAFFRVSFPVRVAVLIIGGAIAAEWSRPWVTSPGWWIGATCVLGGAALYRARRLRPVPAWHPGRPGGWVPGGGASTLVLMALAVVAWGGTHHALYVRDLRAALPLEMMGGDVPVDMIGWVEEPIDVRETFSRFRLNVAMIGGGVRALDWKEPPAGTRVEVRVARSSLAGAQGAALDDSGAPLVPRPGERVRVRGLVTLPEPARAPGGFSPRRYYEAQGVSGIVRVPRARHVTPAADPFRIADPRLEERIPPDTRARRTYPSPSALPLSVALRWRHRVEAELESRLEPEAAALLLSMLFGQRQRVTEELQEAFQRSGLMHLLAVSGLHVGFVAGLIGLGSGWLRLPRAVALAVGSSVIGLYVMAVGARPSAVRAGITVFLAMVAGFRRRRADLPTATALAALAIIAHRPAAVFDLSFQLSFVAVLGIWAAVRAWATVPSAPGRPRAAGVIMTAVSRVGNFILQSVIISVAAQLVTAPILWDTFGEVWVMGPVANLIAVPLAGIAVPTGLVGGTVGSAAGPLGPWFTAVAGWATTSLAASARAVAALSHNPVESPDVHPVAWVAWYGVLALVAVYRSPSPHRPHLRVVDWTVRKRPVLLVIGCVVAVSGAIAAVDRLPYVPWRPPLEVYFLDVGQGSAALVRVGGARSYLIDAGRGRWGNPFMDGYDAGRRVVVPALRRLRVRRLDAVIVTHPHEDHYGGVLDVIDAMPVDAIWDNGSPGGSDQGETGYRQVLARAAAKGIPLRSLQAGERIQLGRDVVLDVLHPPHPRLTGTGADVNNNSLVLRLHYPGASWLFTGDVEADGQEAIWRGGYDVQADGMQVPHHGAEGSLWRPFWRAVAPSVAVIPVGRNNFGQPAQRVLDALEAMGATVYRTDRHGTVKAWTRGNGWRIRPSLPSCPDREAGFC